MRKKFVIQNVIDKKYWYGFYTNKNWTEDIFEAKFFYDKEDAEHWIEVNGVDFEGAIFICVEVYINAL